MINIMIPFEGNIVVIEDKWRSPVVTFPHGQRFEIRGISPAYKGYPEIIVYAQVPKDMDTWGEKAAETETGTLRLNKEE